MCLSMTGKNCQAATQSLHVICIASSRASALTFNHHHPHDRHHHSHNNNDDDDDDNLLLTYPGKLLFAS